MTIPTGVVEALTAALVDGADASTALKLALTGYTLVPFGTMPIAYTDDEELQALKTARYGDMFVPKTFEEADPQAIPLYVEPQHNPDLVTFPRCTFKETSPDHYDVLRGDEVMGTVYRFGKGWFIDLPQHRIGDVPAFHSLEQAMGKVSNVLDCPA